MHAQNPWRLWHEWLGSLFGLGSNANTPTGRTADIFAACSAVGGGPGVYTSATGVELSSLVPWLGSNANTPTGRAQLVAMVVVRFCVDGAFNLPRMDGWPKKPAPDTFARAFFVRKGSGHRISEQGQTPTIDNDYNPQWNWCFETEAPSDLSNANIRFEFRDSDLGIFTRDVRGREAYNPRPAHQHTPGSSSADQSRSA